MRKYCTTLIICPAILICTVTASAGPIGYSVQSNGNGHLYAFDLETGVAKDLGVRDFTDAEGMTTIGNTIFAIGGTGDEFWNIGPSSAFKIGPTGSRNGVDAGLAYSSTNGKIYNLQASVTGSWLYQVDGANGQASLIGTSNQFADGLAINTSNAAFAIDACLTDSLYSVNLANGALSLIGSLGLGDVNANAGLEFDEFGTLWAILDDGSIYKINASTGVASLSAHVTYKGRRLAGFEGFAILNSPPPSGPEEVPEPAGIVLFGIGALSLAAYNWRQRKVA